MKLTPILSWKEISKMKKLTPLLRVAIIVGLVVVVLGGTTAGMWISAYNGEITRRENVTEERGNVHASLSGRYEKVGTFIDAIESANQTVLTYLETIRDARTAFADAIASNEPVDADAAAETIDSTFVQLVAYMEDNPESYNTVDLYAGYMAEFAASTNAVTYAITEFNGVVNDYNTFIQTFPNVIFLGGKVTFEPYSLANYNATLPTFN